jgi:hypothetical protein
MRQKCFSILFKKLWTKQSMKGALTRPISIADFSVFAISSVG